jgi:glycosyltransferase involved in cell wall biosynthesis
MDNISRLWTTIQDQTQRPDEWIIADNGSSDGTREWLAQHSETSRFPVTVLSLPGKTIAQMMNVAISRARYDVIACCHGGTRIPIDWLENILAPLQTDPDIDVSGGVWVPYGESRLERWVAKSIYNDCELADDRTYCPASRSIAFKRSAWEKAGGFPEWLPKFGEDFLFAVRLHATGARLRVAPRAVIGWRPKPALWPLMRQHFYHGQADACLGIAPILRPMQLRFVLPGLAALVVGLLFRHWLPALLAFLAVLIMDHCVLQAFRKRYYKSFFHYLLWEWFVRLAWLAGGIQGLRMLARGQVQRPAFDTAALHLHLSKLKPKSFAPSAPAP